MIVERLKSVPLAVPASPAPARRSLVRPLVSTVARIALAGALTCGLAACANHHRQAKVKPDALTSRVTQIGINAWLWRASLDTLSFMPLLQTDSNGGVILTDWYANPKNPGERVKVTVSILDKELRADALRVAASRQTLQNGNWIEAPVQAATVQKLEDIILTRARDLRRKSLANQ